MFVSSLSFISCHLLVSNSVLGNLSLSPVSRMFQPSCLVEDLIYHLPKTSTHVVSSNVIRDSSQSQNPEKKHPIHKAPVPNATITVFITSLSHFHESYIQIKLTIVFWAIFNCKKMVNNIIDTNKYNLIVITL